MVPPMKRTLRERLILLKQDLRFRLRYIRCRRGVIRSMAEAERNLRPLYKERKE